MESSDSVKSTGHRAETDPRFPSGAWVGFWTQPGHGKYKMSVQLSFRDDRVAGAGSDIVGRFTMHGTYDVRTGRYRLTKQYGCAHSLEYEGISEAAGQWLWGVWQLWGDRGGFHLWPSRKDRPAPNGWRATIQMPLQSECCISMTASSR